MNKGYTLIEILIVLALLAIMTGIATVSYNSYIVHSHKKDILTAGKVFLMSVKNCISATGGWSIKRTDGTKATPCEAKGNQDSELAEVKKQLKKRLNFDCPKDAVCRAWTHRNNLWHCLSIEKTTQGKKIQVLVRLAVDGSKTQNFCGDGMSVFLRLYDRTCRREVDQRVKNKLTENCPW